MNIKEIKELIEAVCRNGIAELEVERAGVKVRIRKEGQTSLMGSALPAPGLAASYPASNSSPIGGVSSPTKPATDASLVVNDDNLFIVRSPIVGTFYRAANPNGEPFVKLGDLVESGQILCIIEAMKLMNEIESEVSGEVVKIYLENGEPVEFGQSLFGIRPIT
jgi:oxaloacetate decarboxylase alpha subunit